jgi:hypothetical protein
MKKLFILGIVMIFLNSCADENKDNHITAETIQNLPSIKEYKNLADAIDNIDKTSKISIEKQITNYLDKKLSKNFSAELSDYKAKLRVTSSTNSTARLESPTEILDLDQQLNDVGFSYLQKQYISKITSLYPLEDASAVEVSDDVVVSEIKNGLINIRNIIADDGGLSKVERYQLFDYIDVQYATLNSVVDYVKTNMDSSLTPTAKFKISFKKIVNVVVSIVITTAICLISAAIVSLGNPEAAVIGGIAGFVSGVISSTKNSCIKFCGTGYCNTDWDDCYTSQYKTFFVLKSN